VLFLGLFRFDVGALQQSHEAKAACSRFLLLVVVAGARAHTSRRVSGQGLRSTTLETSNKSELAPEQQHLE